MNAKKTKEFTTLKFDGSAVHAVWSQLYTQLGRILHHAIEQKEAGRGVFARPETDPGLIGLLSVMDDIDPERGWFETGLRTYAYSLTDALRDASNISWAHEWGYPVEGDYGLFEDNRAAILLKAPLRTNTATRREMMRVLSGAGEFRKPEKPTKKDRELRRALYDVLNAAAAAAKQIRPRPDGSIPALKGGPLPEISNPEIEPLWRNKLYPPIPGTGAPFIRKFGALVMSSVLGIAENARTVFEYAPKDFGLEEMERDDDEEEVQFPYLKNWFNGRGTMLTETFLDLAILDRQCGSSAKDILSAQLSKGRLEACLTWWSRPSLPRWISRASYSDILANCGLGDKLSPQIWAESFSGNDYRDPGPQCFNEILCAWITDKSWPKKLKLPKKIDPYKTGFVKAMQGLCEGKAANVSAGVQEMLNSHTKFEYTGGRKFPQLCLEAIALQRIAKQTGLKLKVSAEPPNDMELVEAANPDKPQMKWSIYPGLELVTQSPGKYAWPALYLNQPITTVDDPPLK